jgi:hypothetical protein
LGLTLAQFGLKLEKLEKLFFLALKQEFALWLQFGLTLALLALTLLFTLLLHLGLTPNW